MKYIKVIIDNVSDHTDVLYTYRCESDEVMPGNVVYVPFGKGNRHKTAYVFGVSDENDDNIKHLKDVESIETAYSVPESLMKICEWMKEKYVCRYIDAVKCVIPPGAEAKRGKRKDPYANLEVERDEEPDLTEEQAIAVNKISAVSDKRAHKVFLLNGVTSSGKTEVYMRVTSHVLSQGRSVIILVPEISLTPQTIGRFVARFGNEKIAVLHSKLTKGQRYDQWMRVRNGEAQVLIGARSGIFAPFENIGAIIIDEEHEASYKSDMTPKYDAIDTAIARAGMAQAVVVLGTATPSIVSEYKAQSGIYEEIRMLKRYNLTPLPAVEVVDMREEMKQGNRSIFSKSLYSKTLQTLKEGRQVIFFLNRRGYSSFVSCRSCGFVMKCDTCGVSLTYHKTSGMAECHYCGKRIKIPSTCPSCGSKYIRHFGIGTERVEEVSAEMFSEYTVARLDFDTARKKGETERILNDFKKGRTNILVGTQLVAKGLDFANVGLVGIISADITLNIPDYRSSERTFQLIVQASGRAGRGDKAGAVVIQTYSPQERAILDAANGDYDSFYQHEIRMRSLTSYPPFTKIIRLVFIAENEKNVIDESQILYNSIKNSGIAAAGELFAPQPAYMARLNDNYRYHLIIKSPLEKTTAYLKLISECKEKRTASNATKTTMLTEINPYSFT